MTSVGAVELGRGVVVLPGDAPPLNWASCPRVVIDDASLENPGPVAEELHGYWFDRRPVVVELAVDPAALRAPEHCGRPVYELTPQFEFSRERLQFLVWANNYDARGGVPIWWHGRKAARRVASEGIREVETAAGAGDGAGADDVKTGDIVMADGTAVYIDGGPPQPPELGSGTQVVHRWNAEAGRLRPAGGVHAPSHLAPDQLAAVHHRAGPARVIAPAGSGKTRVLTERLRHLVTECGVHPATLTALAYNNKAAAEMRQRCA
ncbi:MAG: UvrD-helicase domain-containing protein, partial [Trebonia sp.]